MALGLTVTKETPEEGYVVLQATGMTAGTKYDVFRLQLRRQINDLGLPIYERIYPDHRGLWTAVQHRVGWTAPATTATFRDYDTPLRPTQYFIVPTASVSPYEYADWGVAYPVSRGFLNTTVVDFWWDLKGTPANKPGIIRVRSVAHAAKFVDACVVEMGDIKYTARGTELAVMGSQYPVYVGDVREARRGSIVLKCGSLAEFDDLRNIVFPPTGKIWPVIFNSASEPPLILNDMRVIPLDVTLEQATASDAALRYLHIDYVEINPTAPLAHRVGDNDDLVNAPKANFTVSDATPAVNQWVTLTDTSTGQYDSWDWTVPGNAAAYALGFPSGGTPKFQSAGPHRVMWARPGTYAVKLWVGGAMVEMVPPGTSAGSHSRVKYVTVHR
jgi:hypothetical protein